MIIPDINLLLYAYFSVFPLHEAARRWWEGIGERGESVGIAPPVLFGFVRIATNRRVFVHPMDLQHATGSSRTGWHFQACTCCVPDRVT